ncbi:MAG: DUF2339 domain-containing protein [Bacteroidales bacterium]|nr:DUF2339 domain-containing protein [Bacteroidales bacterium]
MNRTMEANQNKLDELLRRIEELSNRNEYFLREIKQLKEEVQILKNAPKEEVKDNVSPVEESKPIIDQTLQSPVKETIAEPIPQTFKKQSISQQQSHRGKEKSNLEEFIGGRIINIVGIAITVIGIGLGAKYAIDRNWLSPMVRVVLGYLAGIILISIALKVRKKYDAFSAALLSGGISVMYFISYFAYSFYNIIPPLAAFVLMLIFTLFAVGSALQYNRQIIAHLGLVGAYAIPFITDTGLENGLVLFIYMIIINMGILFLAFKKDWKALNYVAFGFSWLIFVSWYFDTEAYYNSLGMSFTFAILFFLQFYLLVLAYKLIRNEKFGVGDVILLLSNTFFFYGIGYHIMDEGLFSKDYLGLFTIGNAVLHFLIAGLLWLKEVQDKNFRLFTLGLVVTFITIAIPVQLNGYWVTLLWIAEAVVLFWIGRGRKASVYEYLSYPLIFLAFFSLVHDWYTIYPEYYRNSEAEIVFIFNRHFLNSILVAAGFGAIAVINRNKKYLEGREKQLFYKQFLDYTLPILVFFVVFYAVRMEIVTFWNKQMTNFSFRVNDYNRQIRMLRRLTLHDYYMIYLVILYILNIRLYKSKVFAHILNTISAVLLLAFVVLGLRRIGILKEEFASSLFTEDGAISSIAFWIGYISYTVTASLLFFTNLTIKTIITERSYKKLFSILSHFIIISILTGELFHSLDKLTYVENPNIFISILWGLYAVMIISLGIAKKRKHLRISAIVLFGITLFKLFIYDISNVTALGRFILLVALGILLIIISFLYAKYKHIILMKDEE